MVKLTHTRRAATGVPAQNKRIHQADLIGAHKMAPQLLLTELLNLIDCVPRAETDAGPCTRQHPWHPCPWPLTHATASTEAPRRIHSACHVIPHAAFHRASINGHCHMPRHHKIWLAVWHARATPRSIGAPAQALGMAARRAC